ncbi:hypothetical protein DCS_04346 [Drechmeria coniospora]|uniref:Uncharacterized protein n=1 Tax=Drechmeria coniospora TaxID=98403 RepID=A0A151GJR0_DRECN|nr:hypothetical protein DCS_04346 [Drechmeria coniospora]KYK57337.1 hypothetical protein DCS_04346 [Drechmeria coniospora]
MPKSGATATSLFRFGRAIGAIIANQARPRRARFRIEQSLRRRQSPPLFSLDFFFPSSATKPSMLHAGALDSCTRPAIVTRLAHHHPVQAGSFRLPRGESVRIILSLRPRVLMMNDMTATPSFSNWKFSDGEARTPAGGFVARLCVMHEQDRLPPPPPSGGITTFAADDAITNHPSEGSDAALPRMKTALVAAPRARASVLVSLADECRRREGVQVPQDVGASRLAKPSGNQMLALPAGHCTALPQPVRMDGAPSCARACHVRGPDLAVLAEMHQLDRARETPADNVTPSSQERQPFPDEGSGQPPPTSIITGRRPISPPRACTLVSKAHRKRSFVQTNHYGGV